MSIIFGLISLLLSICIPVLILVLTKFSLINFSLFFIIPVGAIAIGYVCGFGYYKGLVKSNVFITKKHLLIGVLIAIICIVGIKYTEYKLTCLDPYAFDVVYSLNGDHISNYEVDGYGQLNFINFTRFMIESTPISFSYRTTSLGEVSNPIATWVFALIDFLGLIAGCVYAGIAQKSKPYCHDCQVYFKMKKYLSVAGENAAAFFGDLKDIISGTNTEKTLEALLDEYQTKKPNKRKEHYACTLVYCDYCKKAYLKFEHYELSSRKQLQLNSNFNYSVDVDYNIAEKIINQAAV